MEKNKKYNKNLIPPDGGWGWVVIFGSGLATFNLSIFSIYGLLFGNKIEAMGEGTKGTALVANIMFLMYNITGPISGQLINRTSYRKVAILGSFLTATGMMLSSLATCLWHLILSYSIILGAGMGMITTATFVAVNSYFIEKKGKAVGLCFCGAGIGQVLMPQIVKYLLNEYSYRGTTLLLGGVCLHGVAGGLLLQPVQWHLKSKEKIVDDETQCLNNPIATNSNVYDSNGKRSVILDEEPKNERELDNNLRGRSEINDELSKQSLIKYLVTSLDLKLFTKPRFVFVMLGCCFAMGTLLNFEMIFPFIMQNVINMSTEETAYAMSLNAVADLTGRFAIPIITDKYKIKPLHCILFSCVFLGTLRQFMMYTTSYLAAMILVSMNGLGMSFITVFNNLTVAKECNVDQVPTAIGLYMMARGIIILPMGFFIGWIRDYVNSYFVCVSVLNAFNFAVLLIWSPFIWRDWQNRAR